MMIEGIFMSPVEARLFAAQRAGEELGVRVSIAAGMAAVYGTVIAMKRQGISPAFFMLDGTDLPPEKVMNCGMADYARELRIPLVIARNFEVVDLQQSIEKVLSALSG